MSIKEEITRELAKDFFVLFELQPSYDVCLNSLRLSYLKLQRKYHPDKFINSSSELSSLALVLSSYVNEGYETLKSPITRGTYLLQLNGLRLDLAKDTQLPQKFILMQMDIHDRIDDAIRLNDQLELNKITQEVMSLEDGVIYELGRLFENNSYNEAIELIKQLKFYERLRESVIPV